MSTLRCSRTPQDDSLTWLIGLTTAFFPAPAAFSRVKVLVFFVDGLGFFSVDIAFFDVEAFADAAGGMGVKVQQEQMTVKIGRRRARDIRT